MALPVSHTQSKFKALFTCHDHWEPLFCSQRCQREGKILLVGKISWRETEGREGGGNEKASSLSCSTLRIRS